MTILLALIPVMILAVAIATGPLIYAMRLEHREQLAAMAGSGPTQPGEETECEAAPLAA